MALGKPKERLSNKGKKLLLGGNLKYFISKLLLRDQCDSAFY
jgi:hypothetical protein